MSIASAITAAQGRVANAYTAVANKGGTLPATQNLSNLPAAINSIPSSSGYSEIPDYSVTNGVASSISINLTGNEFSNITTVNDYAFWNSFAYRRNMTGGVDLSSLTSVAERGCHSMFSRSGITGVIDLSSLINIGLYGCYSMFNYTTGISGTVDLSSLTTVGQYGCGYMFQGCTGITGFDLSSLTTIPTNSSSACYWMFYECTGITGKADLSSLETIIGSGGCNTMFGYCTGITSVDLSSLTTINSSGGYCMFANCTGITSVDMSSLESLGTRGCESMFANCTGLTSFDFQSLKTVSSSQACVSMFSRCTNLSRISFYALRSNSFGNKTDQFNKMLYNVVGCTVHFPMAVQSIIGSWADVTAGFGGSGTTVLFDIVTTLIGADSNLYTRKQKESTLTATAWEYNSTTYYTSGTTEPTVGATIYSDAACTTSVTTISSIL